MESQTLLQFLGNEINIIKKMFTLDLQFRIIGVAT